MVPTLNGGGVPTLYSERRYLPWMGGGGRGTYLGQGERVPTLDGGGVPTLEGTPSLDRGYLLWMGGSTYLGQAMLQAASCDFP